MRRVLISALVLSACITGAPLPPASGALNVGQTLALKIPTYPDGAVHDLATDRGSVVLLDVWATWCEPCAETLPLYQQLLADFGPRGLKVYALSEDKDVRQVKKFIEKNHLTLPVLLDPDSSIAEQKLAVTVMPTAFLIDRHGQIRHVHPGALENIPAMYEMYKSELTPLLAESGR